MKVDVPVFAEQGDRVVDPPLHARAQRFDDGFPAHCLNVLACFPFDIGRRCVSQMGARRCRRIGQDPLAQFAEEAHHPRSAILCENTVGLAVEVDQAVEFSCDERRRGRERAARTDPLAELRRARERVRTPARAAGDDKALQSERIRDRGDVMCGVADPASPECR